MDIEGVGKYRKSRRQVKKEKKIQKEKTAGKGWFDMPAADSEEIKNDIMMLRMRNAIDPKRFYKKEDKESKFCQIGTVVDTPLEHYDRVPHRERKDNLVEQLLGDMDSRKKLKNRYKKAVKEHPYYRKIRRKTRLKKKEAKDGPKLKRRRRTLPKTGGFKNERNMGKGKSRRKI